MKKIVELFRTLEQLSSKPKRSKLSETVQNLVLIIHLASNIEEVARSEEAKEIARKIRKIAEEALADLIREVEKALGELDGEIGEKVEKELKRMLLELERE